MGKNHTILTLLFYFIAKPPKIIFGKQSKNKKISPFLKNPENTQRELFISPIIPRVFFDFSLFFYETANYHVSFLFSDSNYYSRVFISEERGFGFTRKISEQPAP